MFALFLCTAQKGRLDFRNREILENHHALMPPMKNPFESVAALPEEQVAVFSATKAQFLAHFGTNYNLSHPLCIEKFHLTFARGSEATAIVEVFSKLAFIRMILPHRTPGMTVAEVLTVVHQCAAWTDELNEIVCQKAGIDMAKASTVYFSPGYVVLYEPNENSVGGSLC